MRLAVHVARIGQKEKEGERRKEKGRNVSKILV
jgi:hypothetical protein